MRGGERKGKKKRRERGYERKGKRGEMEGKFRGKSENTTHPRHCASGKNSGKLGVRKIAHHVKKFI